MHLTIALIIPVLLVYSFEVKSQEYHKAVAKLNSIYEVHGLSSVSEPIVFDSLTRILEIDNYRVPMSDNTFIQCVKNRRAKDGMKYSAKFYMQQGETITLKGNDLIQKAFLAIPLSDQGICKAFVFQLEQLKKE
ncbi:MAG TPA: hypothetical protein VGA21_13725 [Cyclobacteriaceae bacterium]|jgi:hypothetical protein